MLRFGISNFTAPPNLNKSFPIIQLQDAVGTRQLHEVLKKMPNLSTVVILATYANPGDRHPVNVTMAGITVCMSLAISLSLRSSASHCLLTIEHQNIIEDDRIGYWVCWG